MEKEDFCGTWRKDLARCESMDAAFKAVSLPYLYRLAVRYLNTMRIEIKDQSLIIIVKAGGMMDVVETYPLSGDCALQKRRDKRKGAVHGTVELIDGRMTVRQDYFLT
jgi:hypothetical protein